MKIGFKKLRKLRYVMGHRKSSAKQKPLAEPEGEPGLSDLVRAVVLAIMAGAAVLTVLTSIAQICGMRFSTYAIIGAAAAIVVAALVLWSEISRRFLRVVTARPGAAAALLGCSLLGGVLALTSHRSDLDDCAYVPNVIYYLEHPAEPMGFKIHFIDSGSDEPFMSYHRCAIAFEYSQGIVSHITGIGFLTVYYLFAPALFGCMIPLAWFYVISRFSFPSWTATTGAFIICMSLLLMGEQHRSFGNFAFNRIFEGKTVTFAVGFPMFIGLTMDFFRSPGVRKWIYLLAISTAMVGFTAASAVLMPLLGFVLAIACCVSYVPNIKSCFRRGLVYFCSMIYPVIYAASILLLSLEQLGSDKAINEGWPRDFMGHAKFVFDGPVVLSFLVVGSILGVVLVGRRDRRFLVAWTVLAVVCYLNPIISPIIIEHVTSPNIYWRLFYLLPFPLVIGLSGAAVALRLGTKRPIWRRLAFAVVTILLLAAHWPSSSSSVFRYGSYVTKLGVPRYKTYNLSRARKVVELAPPPGAMLAATDISYLLPMLSSKYPQISSRPDAILMWMEECGRKAEGIHRLIASDFLMGKVREKSSESLIWVIQQNPHIRSVVADRRIAEGGNSYLFKLMGNLGFAEHKFADDLVVFIRCVSEK